METMTTVETTTTATTPQATMTGAERRTAAKEKAMARHAKLVQATAADRDHDRATRHAEGVTGREGYVAWTFERMETIRNAMHDTVATLTLSHLHATKRGSRCTVTGVALVGGETIALKGEATVLDTLGENLTGVTVDVKLTRSEDRNGQVTATFQGESVGVSSTGKRVGLRVRLQASRYVRTIASAL